MEGVGAADDIKADDVFIEAGVELGDMADDIGWDVVVAGELPTTVRDVPIPRLRKLFEFEQQPWYTKS